MSIETTRLLDAAKQALESLENYDGQTWEETKEAITSLRQAIATEESLATQEPVATTAADHAIGEIGYCKFHAAVPYDTKLYIHPQPKREWVGLTDEERKKIAYNTAELLVARQIEAKLKEKNT